MFNTEQHLHFVGIGGVGMAGIAEVLLNLGYSVGGSDVKQTQLTEHLKELGAEIYLGHRAENLNSSTSVVIVSSAVQADNPELLAARERALPVIPRAEMLAELMRMKYGVAVAGSHGKTTTTTMISRVLDAGGLDPTAIIGGRVLTTKTGVRLGRGEFLVAEADESDGSFRLLRPAISVVTNIDREHLSHYGTFGALEEAFHGFMSSVPFYGLVVACFDDPVVRRLAESIKRRVVSYGFVAGADYVASDIEIDGPVSTFTLVVRGVEIERVVLPVPGVHMVANALAAIATGVELGVSYQAIFKALRSFPGVSRRSEVLSEAQGILLIDDYAHHPTEIAATLRAIRQGWVPFWMRRNGTTHGSVPGRLIVMFEPHRYSRTRELFSEFLNSFSDCDELYLTEIYPAGEEPLSGVSGEILALAIQHPKVTFAPNLRELFNELRPTLRPGDILVTLGAGGITQLAHSFAAELSENSSVLPPLTANISAVQPARLHSPLTNGSLEAASQHVTE